MFQANTFVLRSGRARKCSGPGHRPKAHWTCRFRRRVHTNLDNYAYYHGAETMVRMSGPSLLHLNHSSDCDVAWVAEGSSLRSSVRIHEQAKPCKSRFYPCKTSYPIRGGEPPHYGMSAHRRLHYGSLTGQGQHQAGIFASCRLRQLEANHAQVLHNGYGALAHHEHVSNPCSNGLPNTGSIHGWPFMRML